MLREGDKAPDFQATSSDGKSVSLADFLGKKNLVFYFYPKDFSPVCTRETCGFRDLLAELGDEHTAIIGVSGDDDESHEEFRKKHDVNFDLLTDPEGKLAERFGAKSSGLGGLIGKTKRVTYVIDKKGIVRGVFDSMLRAGQHLDGTRSVLAQLARE